MVIGGLRWMVPMFYLRETVPRPHLSGELEGLNCAVYGESRLRRSSAYCVKDCALGCYYVHNDVACI